MKSPSACSRSGIGLLILLVLVCSSVVWADDAGTRPRCTVAAQGKTSPDPAQLTLKNANNTSGLTGAGNDAGESTLLNMLPGTYELTVEKDGFAPEKFGNVTLGQQLESAR